MPAIKIDGNAIASKIREKVKEKASKLKTKPGLAVILIGDNPSSEIYIKGKNKACNEVGFYFELKRLKEDVNEEEVLKLIDSLNQDEKIHGIVVQLPLPKHLNTHLIIDAVLPHKDADGFNPFNLGNLLIGNQNEIIPATPKGIIKLIESTGMDLEGKYAVVVGRSNIVGKPISLLLQQKDCTVTMCHSKTKGLEKYTKEADILVVAIGKPKFITSNMVKKGAIVIDVGINKVYDKLVGDVDFDEVSKVAGYITSVPGGVGPMTIACLLENTLECIKLQENVFKIKL